jgi:error-prone DNA polymerase
MSRIRIDPSTRMPFEEEANPSLDLGILGSSASHDKSSSARDGIAGVAKELALLRRTIAERKSRYVELSVRTNFSFLSGATSPEYMVFRAAELGYDAIAITDRDGIYGVVRACEEAAKHGIRVIIGCELTLEREGLEDVPDVPGKPTTLTVLVENHTGYTNLCKILTESHKRHPKSIPIKRADNLDEDELPRNTFAGLPLSFVCKHAAGLWALADAALLNTVLRPDPRAIPSAPRVPELVRAFGSRLSVMVHLHKDGEDRVRVERTLAAARTYGLPICATNRVLHARSEDKPVLDVLHCIREGKTLDEAGRDLGPNTEAHLKDEEEILRLFSLHPEWTARSRFIADRCVFSIKELAYRFPYEISDLVHRDFRNPNGDANSETAQDALRRLTYEGAHVRYGETIPEKVVTQIEKELTLIDKLEVAPYFLSVRAVVDMARRRDILCQGRGSAANSAVCFCLGITAVDPSRANMLFERFLSAERREPPDIDVDFEHERREEVIQEIYQTYGRDRAAMVCEIVSYRSKSALREVGKVFGFSLEQIDRLAGVVSWWDGMGAVSESRLRAIGFSADDPRVRQTLVMAKAIQGFPRHLSIHVGGFVLSAAPLSEVAPIEPATMTNRSIIPWDKDDIDTLGFFKIDVLGLGMLTAIRKCLDLVRDVAQGAGEKDPLGDPQTAPGAREPRTPIGSDILSAGSAAPAMKATAIERLARIPAEDPVVYDALCRADTVGVFQIESRAQMAMLPRLRPRNFYDLVIEVAIVRPGPIQGGMVHPYLRRRTGEEPHTPPHPLLQPILARTLGVPLFQEQVMQIAIVGAGYSGGEADRLRRDMAAWRKTGSLEKHRGRLLEGFRERGIPEEFGERLYQQIHGFAEYGFPECVASETLVLDASTGRRVRIEDVVHGRATLSTTFACDSHKRLRKRRVLKATSSGPREVFRLRTALGREVTATAEHPLLTIDGWRPLASLSPGERVATARRLPPLGHRRRRRHEILALADVISKGSTCLPSEVFELSSSNVALFLARLWERNGGFSLEHKPSYDTPTRVLAEQLQHLMLRFGIVTRLRERAPRGRDGFRITVASVASLGRFCRYVARRFSDPQKHLLSQKIAHAVQARRGAMAACTNAPSNARINASDVYWDRVVSIERVGVRETYDLTIEGDHNFIANDFIVHNSHASSFALLVYASSWLKVHYPAELAAALINSQPMGFYSPSTLLSDAQRHGVELLPIDVNVSGWDCACVRIPKSWGCRPNQWGDPTHPQGQASPLFSKSPKTDETKTAIRLGLRLVSGLGEDAGRRIEQARALGSLTSVDDVVHRARLDKKESMALAESGALDRLSAKECDESPRRAAIWQVVAPRSTDLFEGTTWKRSKNARGAPGAGPLEPKELKLAPMTRAEQLVLDYECTGVSIEDHPMKLLRPSLPKRFKHSKNLMSLRSGTRVSSAGLVTCRQRPGTASGVVFITLEDEFGFMNLVLWSRVFEKFHHTATTARLMIVHGRVERSDDPKGLRPADPNAPQSVVHVITDVVERLDEKLPKLGSMSRDFH